MNNTERTEPVIATYLHEKGGRLGLPVSGTFELTSRCNFSCPMCYVHDQMKDSDNLSSELSAEQWINIAQSACDSGMMFALLTGGEPLLRRDFFEIYSAMKSMGLMISVNTNGSLLKGETLRKLIENPPFRVNISLYGGCAETYRNMCGNNAFADVTGAILSLKDAGVDVRLNLSLTPMNKDDMQIIYEFANENGIHIKFNTYMYPPHRIKDTDTASHSRFTPDEAARYSSQWDYLRLGEEEYKKRCERILANTFLSDDECMVDMDKGVRCRAGRSSFWITWDGKLLPCGMMTSPAVSLNLLSFTEAWAYIKAESENLYLPEHCVTCSKRKICNVCPAVCVSETGSFKGIPEYLCQYTDELISFAKDYMDKQ